MKHDKLTFWEFTFLGLLEWNYFESKGDRKFSCKNIDRVRTLAKGMDYILSLIHISSRYPASTSSIRWESYR